MDAGPSLRRPRNELQGDEQAPELLDSLLNGHAAARRQAARRVGAGLH
jgi:hypothetical protein